MSYIPFNYTGLYVLIWNAQHSLVTDHLKIGLKKAEFF